MVKLYNQGVYLLNGSEIVPDGADAVREIDGKGDYCIPHSEGAQYVSGYGAPQNQI